MQDVEFWEQLIHAFKNTEIKNIEIKKKYCMGQQNWHQIGTHALPIPTSYLVPCLSHVGLFLM